jgi:hypothetical protein
MTDPYQIAQTGFEGEAFVLAHWAFTDRFRNAKGGRKEQASDWFKRKSDQRFDPYPDINGNTSGSIEVLFLAGAAGQFLFFIGSAIWLTLFLIPTLYALPLPVAFLSSVDQLATVAALASLVGAAVFFSCIRSLASRKRRYSSPTSLCGWASS